MTKIGYFFQFKFPKLKKKFPTICWSGLQWIETICAEFPDVKNKIKIGNFQEISLKQNELKAIMMTSTVQFEVNPGDKISLTVVT